MINIAIKNNEVPQLRHLMHLEHLSLLLPVLLLLRRRLLVVAGGAPSSNSSELVKLFDEAAVVLAGSSAVAVETEPLGAGLPLSSFSQSGVSFIVALVVVVVVAQENS